MFEGHLYHAVLGQCRHPCQLPNSGAVTPGAGKGGGEHSGVSLTQEGESKKSSKSQVKRCCGNEDRGPLSLPRAWYPGLLLISHGDGTTLMTTAFRSQRSFVTAT